jgi:hypothetical protein
MPKFELFIPAADSGGFDTTLKVDAANWMQALKAGLSKLGEQGSTIQNVLVDIQDDNSIHVTEPKDGRVFRIKELTEEEAARAPIKRPSQIRMASVPASSAKTEINQAVVIPPRSDRPDAITQPGLTPIGSSSNPTAGIPDRPRPQTRPPPRAMSRSQRIDVSKLNMDELRAPVAAPAKGTIGRVKSSPGLPARVNIEDMLAEIFERVQNIHAKPSVDDALGFILDLALEKVPADSGSIFRADYATGDLSFAVARGPKARELLSSKIVIPAGNGIAGFCQMEGVSLAISDVDKDPRHYSAVADKVDYEVTSLACAPMMTHGRSFGCIQLINKKASHTFADHEIGVLSYLAHQAALYLNDRA